MEDAVEAPLRDSSRKGWRAAVLSLLTPGLGHLYNGAPRRALIAWLLCIGGAVVGTSWAMRLNGSKELVALVVINMSIQIGIAWDAAWRARATPSGFAARAYNRWYVYVGIITISLFVIQPRLTAYLRANIVNSFVLPTTAMAPTLLNNDYVLATPLRAAPMRADIVVYRTRSASYVKRIVGISGDTINMVAGRLFVNRRPVDEPYATQGDADRTAPEFEWQRAYVLASVDRGAYHPSLETWGPLLIPNDLYFTLGDNRGSSEDSRYDGFVARRDIIARPTIVYFSRDPIANRVRWSRVGVAIQ